MLCFRMGTWGHQQWPLWCSLNDQNEPGRTQWIKWSQRNTGMCWTHWLSRSVTHHIRGFCSPKHLLPLDDAWLAKCIRLRTQNAAARAYGTSLVDFRFRVQPQLNFGGKKKKISSVCPPSRSLRLRVEWINNEVMSKYYGCLLLFIIINNKRHGRTALSCSSRTFMTRGSPSSSSLFHSVTVTVKE